MTDATVNSNGLSGVKKERESSKWLTKTRMCVYYIQGSCRLDSRCNFAHSPSEIQDVPNLHKTQLCQNFELGKCNDEYCSFAHGEADLRNSSFSKSKICKWFLKDK